MVFYSGETLTAADLNAMLTAQAADAAAIAVLQGQVAALQAATLDSGWLAVASTVGFAGTWSDYPGWAPASYRKIGKNVFIKGLVRNGAVGSVIFTLPAGYRPSDLQMFSGINDVRTIGVALGGTGGDPTPNITSNSGSGNTGGASAGTAHTHDRGNHQHGLQNHNHANGGTGSGSILNIGMRFDIDTAGNVVAASSAGAGYQSVWCNFLVP